MPTAANKKRTRGVQPQRSNSETVFEDPPITLSVATVRSHSITSGSSSRRPPSARSNSQRGAPVEVDDERSDSSDEETWSMPGWRYVCRQVYDYTVGSVRCLRGVHRRRRLGSSVSHVSDSSSSSSSSNEGEREGEGQHLLAAKREEKMKNRDEERKMRLRLKFHFMNPFQKWKYTKRRRFPFKLGFQLLAIILVTAQTILFGEIKSAKTRFILSNKVTINTLFLDFASEDSMVVYSMDDLYHQMQRIVDTYYNIEAIAVAPYDYIDDGNETNPTGPPVLYAKVVQHDKWKFDASNHDIYLSAETHEFPIPLYFGRNETCGNCSIRAQLEPRVNASSIGSIKTLSVHFKLTSFFIDQQEVQYISCVTFDITILFNNVALSGTIPVEVTAEPTVFNCNNSQKNLEFYTEVFRHYVVLDLFILIVMLVYSLLCLRSIVGSCILTKDVYKFFRRRYDKRLTWGHIKSLQSFWFYFVILGNLLVTLGTVLKIILAFKAVFNVQLEDMTTLILGLGVFCQWCGLLRFLSYFDTYNILLLTLRLSIPSVLRFSVCAGILYIAFMFLGWLVLGPYHTKFTDLSITSECLFSLLNGDDMYMTYKEMPQTSFALWVFSKIYLYLFISLFIYVVLSVFIGLISDTYETLNEHWYSRSKGFLREFALGGMARWKRRRKALTRMNPTFQEVQEVQTGEGFILVNNDEDGQEGESRASGSGSGEDTDGGYRSINGNSSPTVHDVERGASNFRNYGSINRSRSDGRQGDTRHTFTSRLVSCTEESYPGTGSVAISLAPLPPRRRRKSWPSLHSFEGSPPPA